MLKSIGLLRFLKGDHDNQVPGCANYDHHRGGCLVGNGCKVENGKRCEYFERAVLPSAIPLGLNAIVSQSYADKVGLTGFCPKKLKDARRCDCGNALRPRQRYCEKCREIKRKQTYRKIREEKRILACVTRNS